MPCNSLKRRFVLITIAIIILSFVALANRPLADTETQQFAGKVDSLFAQWDKKDSPGCAVAIVKDGTTVYKNGFGCANLECGFRVKAIYGLFRSHAGA
jgi:CubicO group peptidase (beta-lactamase class C family)